MLFVVLSQRTTWTDVIGIHQILWQWSVAEQMRDNGLTLPVQYKVVKLKAKMPSRMFCSKLLRKSCVFGKLLTGCMYVKFGLVRPKDTFLLTYQMSSGPEMASTFLGVLGFWCRDACRTEGHKHSVVVSTYPCEQISPDFPHIIDILGYRLWTSRIPCKCILRNIVLKLLRLLNFSYKFCSHQSCLQLCFLFTSTFLHTSISFFHFHCGPLSVFYLAIYFPTLHFIPISPVCVCVCGSWVLMVIFQATAQKIGLS